MKFKKLNLKNLRPLLLSGLLFKVNNNESCPEDFCKALHKINKKINQITSFTLTQNNFDQKGPLLNLRKLSMVINNEISEFYSITITQNKQKEITLEWEMNKDIGKIKFANLADKVLINYNIFIENLVAKFIDCNNKLLLSPGTTLGILNAKIWNEKIKEEEHSLNWLTLTQQMLSEALRLTARLNYSEEFKIRLSMSGLHEQYNLSYSLFNLRFIYNIKASEIEVQVFNMESPTKVDLPTLHIHFKDQFLKMNELAEEAVHLIKKSLKWPIRPVLVQESTTCEQVKNT